MRVFIVDDDPANVRLLESLLTLEGHDCYSAANGREAIEKISAIDPDIVLLDVQMPELDGYETAEHIKSRIHNGRFIPILFLTALTDDAALARCLECGGDDFLSKPYSRVILRSKIRALERVHKLNRQINSQAAELRTQRAQLEKDLDIARGVMAKIARADKIDSSCLSYRVESIERFCGDLVIANRTPTGGLMAFLGDFTGHGLPAAVCALPVTSTFYTMSAKGFSIGEIAVEINEKLKRMLTTGLFCAGCLIEIDATRSTLTIWNGGLPDVLVLDQHGRVRHRARSQHLALGVVEAKRDYRRVDRVEIEAGMQVVAISDGVTEARRTGVMTPVHVYAFCSRLVSRVGVQIPVSAFVPRR